MPTEITAPVANGAITSLDEFAWRCTRQFGPLVHMREAPADAPIPVEIVPSVYYAEQLEQAKRDLAAAETMTDEQLEAQAKQANDAARKRHENYNAEAEAQRKRYESMLEKATAWEPPTPDHQGLKELMISQLEQSIEYDCKRLEEGDAPQLSAEMIREQEIASKKREIERLEQSVAEDQKRAESSTAWLTALAGSVGEPPNKVEKAEQL